MALETTAKYADLTITGAKSKEAAAVIDEDGTATEVAGFVLSIRAAPPAPRCRMS